MMILALLLGLVCSSSALPRGALLRGVAEGDHHDDTSSWVVTASNESPANRLWVLNASNLALLHTVETGGSGGVSGNAGGIVSAGPLLAVVNYGSNTVSVFERVRDALELVQTLTTEAGPVSVAFGETHLYVLSAAHVQSFVYRERGFHLDGTTANAIGDGSSAQVGYIARPTQQLIITEKTGTISAVFLDHDGSIPATVSRGTAVATGLLAPFGLATIRDEAYVAVAHGVPPTVVLVRQTSPHVDALLTSETVSQGAPCWAALWQRFLFTANTAGHSISRFGLFGQRIVPDADAVPAATIANGYAPTDITTGGRHLLAVLSSTSTPSFIAQISVYSLNQDGYLLDPVTVALPATSSHAHTNGIAFL